MYYVIVLVYELGNQYAVDRVIFNIINKLSDIRLRNMIF